MKMQIASFLHARPRDDRRGVANADRQASAPPRRGVHEEGKDSRDKALYLVVLEVIPPERQQS
jgi:hypothetical protein